MARPQAPGQSAACAKLLLVGLKLFTQTTDEQAARRPGDKTKVCVWSGSLRLKGQEVSHGVQARPQPGSHLHCEPLPNCRSETRRDLWCDRLINIILTFFLSECRFLLHRCTFGGVSAEGQGLVFTRPSQDLSRLISRTA